MFSEEDGDSLVGRTVAQLQLNADQFDILTPHFGNSTLNELFQFGWSNILSGYEYYPTSFQRVVPFLLANIVYHWFKGNLTDLYHTDHPLFKQPLFTNQHLLNSLKNKVIFVHAICPETQMSAQGVPGIILISREVRQFRHHYDTTCTSYENRINGLSAQLQNAFEQLPHIIVEKLLERFQINGVIPVSINDIRTLITEMMSTHNISIGHHLTTISQQIQQLQNGQFNTTNNTNNTNQINTAQQQQLLTATTGDVHYWPGVDDLAHMVPYGFKFPSYTCFTMWNLWHFGNATDRICAHKSISVKFDLITDGCKSNFNRTKVIMDKLVTKAIEGGIIERRSDITPQNGNEVYNYSYPLLLSELYSNIPKRPEDININTLGNRVYLKNRH